MDKLLGKSDEQLDDEELEEQEDGIEEGGSGGSEGEAGGKAGTKGAGKAGGKPTSKMFTQEQLTKLATREKNQGRAAALKELGINPKDTKAIEAVKSYLASQKTDEQKAAEGEAARAEAERRAVVAEAKAEAMMLGVQAQYVDDLVVLALAKVSDDNADLKTIIGEFKTKYPVWFGRGTGQEDDEEDEGKDKADKGKKGSGKDEEDAKGKTGQRGTGSSLKDRGKDKGGKEPANGLGARLAAQRKAGNKKSSYWGKS